MDMERNSYFWLNRTWISWRKFFSCKVGRKFCGFASFLFGLKFLFILRYIWIISVGVRTRGGPKPTSKCCVSLSWMVMQGEHTGVYPGSGKRRPFVQRGREVCISLHRSARVGVTSMREGVEPKSQRKEKEDRGDCLRYRSLSGVLPVVSCVSSLSLPFVPWPALL
jgi:hypothetical protein